MRTFVVTCLVVVAGFVKASGSSIATFTFRIRNIFWPTGVFCGGGGGVGYWNF